MSSLQKFHRRTNAKVVVSPFPTIGAGNNTIGYYIGTAGDGVSKMIIDTFSSNDPWYGGYVNTGATDSNDGLTNTNILFSTGGSPAANAAKGSTTGGYNTWYMPAINELITCYQNRNAGAFGTSNAKFGTSKYWSSTQSGKYAAYVIDFGNYGTQTTGGKTNKQWVKPVRRVAN
jgi:hypothetical protein